MCATVYVVYVHCTMSSKGVICTSVYLYIHLTDIPTRYHEHTRKYAHTRLYPNVRMYAHIHICIYIQEIYIF